MSMPIIPEPPVVPISSEAISAWKSAEKPTTPRVLSPHKAKRKRAEALAKIKNDKRFLEEAGKRLGIVNLDDWYNFSKEDLVKLDEADGTPKRTQFLLRSYSNSLIQALLRLFPEHDWLPWRFKRAPLRFWNNVANQRRCIEWMSKQLNIKELDDWYNITQDDIRRLGVTRLFHFYDDSLYKALVAMYPAHEWLPWRFRVTPHGFWRDRSNHRPFMDWVGKQLGIRNLDDWYGTTKEDLVRFGCGSLLMEYYNNSHTKALSAIYPEHEWLMWRFKNVPINFWRDRRNHRLFFEWIAKQLNITHHDDWYKISLEDITQFGSTGLIRHYYRSSVPMALMTIFPEVPWQPWRFPHTFINSPPFLSDVDVLRRYVAFLEKQLQIETKEDWYRVFLEQAREVEGFALFITRNGGLISVLKKVYPEHDWDEQRMRQFRGKRASQRLLKIAAKKLFPDHEVFEEYAHPDLRFGESGTAMTFDVWIPSISLALEYQGIQHYQDVYSIGDNPTKQRTRDDEKREACQGASITLIAVPYWWDKSIEDLASIVTAARPDLSYLKDQLQLQQQQQHSGNNRKVNK